MVHSGFWVNEQHVLLSNNGPGVTDRRVVRPADDGTGTELTSGSISELINIDPAPDYTVYSGRRAGRRLLVGPHPHRA